MSYFCEKEQIWYDTRALTPWAEECIYELVYQLEKITSRLDRERRMYIADEEQEKIEAVAQEIVDTVFPVGREMVGMLVSAIHQRLLNRYWAPKPEMEEDEE